MKLLYKITLNDYIHFNDTNQKENSGDMYAGLTLQTVKKELLIYISYLSRFYTSLIVVIKG